MYHRTVLIWFLFKQSPPKSCMSLSKQESSKGSHRTGGQGRLPIKSHQHCYSWSDESLSMTQSGKRNKEGVSFLCSMFEFLFNKLCLYMWLVKCYSVSFVKVFSLPKLNYIILCFPLVIHIPHYTNQDKLLCS